MGIKDFYKYVKKRWPECFQPVPFQSFAHQKVAIDMMNLMYIFRARNEEQWIGHLIRFLLRLRIQMVHPICVFDGKIHPLKHDTVTKRHDEREKGKRRMQELQDALEHYEKFTECNPALQAYLQRHPEFLSSFTQRPLIPQIRDAIERTSRSYNLSFTSSEIHLLQELIKALGICVLIAPHDGEALCAYLCADNLVDAVLSNDSDVFFFKCKKALCQFTDDGAYLVELEMLLKSMELTWVQFVDLCLLCGTDFNSSVRGIGFCRAYTLIREQGSIWQPSFPLTLDLELLEEVRQFSIPPDLSAYTVTHCRPMTEEMKSEVHNLFFRHHLLSLSDDELAWTKPVLEFET